MYRESQTKAGQVQKALGLENLLWALFLTGVILLNRENESVEMWLGRRVGGGEQILSSIWYFPVRTLLIF